MRELEWDLCQPTTLDTLLLLLRSLGIRDDEQRYIDALCFEQLRMRCSIKPVLKVAALL